MEGGREEGWEGAKLGQKMPHAVGCGCFVGKRKGPVLFKGNGNFSTHKVRKKRSKVDAKT